jgi:hypothetical protein
MATLTITIPDDQLLRVETALCTVNGVAVSAANAKQIVVNYIRQTVIGYETDQNTRAAVAALTPPADPGLT